MLQFFGGGGTTHFTTAPTSGKPTLQLGTGTFDGGTAPDFQGISALGVNMASGYSGNLLDLQVAGVSHASIDYQGTFTTVKNVNIDGGGALLTQFIGFAGAPTMVLAATGWNLTSNGASVTPLLVQGIALQTADIIQALDSTPTNQFGIANAGTGGAPKWALRVAPVANAASMAQSHVGGASTGKAIQVIDNAGVTLGWLQLVA